MLWSLLSTVSRCVLLAFLGGLRAEQPSFAMAMCTTDHGVAGLA